MLPPTSSLSPASATSSLPEDFENCSISSSSSGLSGSARTRGAFYEYRVADALAEQMRSPLARDQSDFTDVLRPTLVGEAPFEEEYQELVVAAGKTPSQSSLSHGESDEESVPGGRTPSPNTLA